MSNPLETGDRDRWARELAELVESRIGLQLTRREALSHLVVQRTHELGFEDPASYLELLGREPVTGPELGRLVAALTNTQTCFFRDREQYAAMRRVLIEHPRTGRRPLYVWSAGCASGEEPYSLAMLALELGVEVRILATDVNQEALSQATAAVYGEWTARRLTGDERQRFFVERDGLLALRHEVRGHVELRLHNLVGEPPPRAGSPSGKWDLISCQNVLIYFAPPTVERTLTSLAASLDSEGWLFLGASEPFYAPGVPLAPVAVAERFPLRPTTAARREPLATLAVEALCAPLAPALPALALTSADKAGATSSWRSILEPLVRHGAFARAITEGESLRAKAGMDAVFLTSLGNLYCRAHAFERGLALYREAQALAPLFAEAHFFEGVALRKLGDLAAAAAALRRALFLEPTFWDAGFLLAGVYGRLGEENRRRRELEHVLTVIARNESYELVSLAAEELRGGVRREDVTQVCRRLLAG